MNEQPVAAVRRVHEHGAWRRADSLVACALGACALAVYALSFQHSYWSDGRLLMTWVETHELRHYHAAYLPLAHAFQFLLGALYGGDPERPLLWLSASSTALAVACTYLAARACGARALAAAFAAAAFASAPGVWFYATCIELHGPHLAVAAIATAWLARAHARGEWGSDALAPACAFLALFATHVGSALWLPALALVALRGGGRWRWPRGAWIALVLGVVALYGWIELTRDLPSGRRFAAEAMTGAVLAWDVHALWTEFLASASLLAVLGVAGLLCCAPESGSGQLALRTVAICALLAYLLVVPGFAYEERGAYFAGAWPLLACGVALAFDHAAHATIPSRARWLPRTSSSLRVSTCVLGAAAIVAQARYAQQYVHAWEHAYRGHEWVEPLRGESANRGFVLVLESWEREAVRKHSRLDAIALRDEGRVARTTGHAAESVAWMLGRALNEGGIAAITTSVLESPESGEFLPTVESLLGPLVPGRSPAYRVLRQPFPAGSAPTATRHAIRKTTTDSAPRNE